VSELVFSPDGGYLAVASFAAPTVVQVYENLYENLHENPDERLLSGRSTREGWRLAVVLELGEAVASLAWRPQTLHDAVPRGSDAAEAAEEMLLAITSRSLSSDRRGGPSLHFWSSAQGPSSVTMPWHRCAGVVHSLAELFGCSFSRGDSGSDDWRGQVLKCALTQPTFRLILFFHIQG